MRNTNFLNGNFYIESSYGLSLVPALLSFVMMKGGESAEAPDKSVLLNEIQQEIKSNQSTPGENATTTTKKVVVLDFKQPVVKYSEYSLLGTQDYISILQNLKTNPDVGAVVMDVDSGGGQAYGTPEFYDCIKDFVSSKPLVIYSGGYLCSAAYYFSAPASKIIVNKRADKVGSIGGYATIIDFKGVYEKFGANVHLIKSSLSDEKNKAYEDVISGKDKDYSQYVKLELDPMVAEFISDMKTARPTIKEEAFKGGTWTGSQVVDMGLADDNGTLQDAINVAFSLIDNNSNTKQKTKSMAKLALPNLESALGLTESLDQKKKTLSNKIGSFLESTQLEALNKALADKDAIIADLTAKNTTLTTDKTALETSKTALETAVTGALTKADLKAGATTEASIALLADKVVEYGGKPGAKNRQSKSDGDQTDEKPSFSIFESIVK